jgi:hypothetical protein
LANRLWEIFLKAIGQPLGTVKGYRKAAGEMPKGYWIASGQFLEGIESRWEIPSLPPSAKRREGRIAQRQSAKMAISIPFL